MAKQVCLTTECRSNNDTSILAIKVMSPEMALELSLIERDYVQNYLWIRVYRNADFTCCNGRSKWKTR